MKTRRWMKVVLKEAKKEQITMPWARGSRPRRASAKQITLSAAE